MTSRRNFIKYSLAAGAGLFLVGRVDLEPALAGPTGAPLQRRTRRVARRALTQIPGGTLNPLTIPQYITPLLIPPVMPKAGTVKQRGGKNVDYYEISVRQFNQQILPAGLPPTTVWGYGAVKAASQKGLLVHNAPSLTIEARWNTPVRVKWINDLKDLNGNPLPHLLPVDPTLHWANPPGGSGGRDTRPTFGSTPGSYTGPVPMVTHVHGAASVGDESDGYAEAWYLPAANNIPTGYATEGTWYDFFKAKAASKGYVAPGQTAWEPGTAVFQYPNSQRASTIWYHDHTLGMTRVNVYAGPAGFFIIRGGPAGDAAVLDSRTGLAAVLPGPAPNTTTVDLSVGWLCQPEHVARQLFAGDNDCAEPACASLAATATTPGAVPVNDRVVAARFPTGGALPGRLVRPGKARAPFFLRRFGTDGG